MLTDEQLKALGELANIMLADQAAIRERQKDIDTAQALQAANDVVI